MRVKPPADGVARLGFRRHVTPVPDCVMPSRVQYFGDTAEWV